MEDGSSTASGGALCPVHHLLHLPQATGNKVLVLRLVRAARVKPAAVMPLLVVALQQEQASVWQKVAVYRSLRAMLENGQQLEPVEEFILVASQHLKASPAQAPRELQVAASNALATLARGHFNPVMTVLQRQLKPFGQPDEFTLLTLGKMAANNVHDCVPFLGITLTTMQTITRRMKDSQRRRALCTALEQICKSIRVYLQSWEKSSYPRISTHQFSAYLFPLYINITRTWLPDSDVQVKLAVLKVLNPMLSILLPKAKFQVQIHEDIPLFFGQYQSITTEAFRVTKIVGQILQASVMSNNPIPGKHAEPIADALICQGSPKVPRKSPAYWKSEDHMEIAPIFLCLARLHPTRLMEFFREKLSGSQDDVTRVELLLLLSDIISAHLPELWSRRHLCLRAVKVVLGDASTKVRLVMLQTIGKMLEAGFLEQVEGWPLSYVSLQLAMSAHRLSHPVRRLPLGGLEEKAVEAASLEVLQVAVALGRGTSQELWVKMLRYLMQSHYTSSAGPLCRTLRLLAEQRLQRVAREQGCLEAVESPTSSELLARLLGLAVSPFKGAGRGKAALLLLQGLHPEVYGDVAEDWGVDVPALLQHLEGCSQYTLEPAPWEGRLLEFLKKSLQRSREPGWNLALAQELRTQISLCPGSSLEREFLYKAWGTALSAARDVAGVGMQLRELLLHTDYTDKAQREGVCWCLTHCVEGQLLATLKALRNFEQEIAEGERLAHCAPNQGWPQPGRTHVRSALLVLYSSLILHAPWQQLRPRLGNVIVPRILHHYDILRSTPEGSKDAELALSFAHCMSRLTCSIPGGHSASTSFQMPHKRALLDRLLDVITAEPLDAHTSPVCQQVLTALQHLHAVPVRLNRQDRREVAQTCVSRIFAMPPPQHIGDKGQSLHAGALTSLARLVDTLLEEEDGVLAATIWFQDVFQLLGSWLVSIQEWQRSWAVDLCAQLLKSHCQKSSSLPRIPSSQFCRLVGVLGPLTGDVLGPTRQGAADSIGILLRSINAPHGNLEWRLHRVRKGLQSESAREVNAASSLLGKVVIRALPSQDVLPFLCSLLEQLQTTSPACGPTALLWLEVAIQMQGLELRDQVSILVATACSCLQPLEDPAQRMLLAQAVSLLAQHHHRMVCAALLDPPLLQDRSRRELWAALATHKARGAARGASTLKLLLTWASMEEAKGMPTLIAALDALQEVTLRLASQTQLTPQIAEVAHTLLVQLGEEDPSAKEPSPASDVDGHPKTELGLPSRRKASIAVLQAMFSQAVPEAAKELDTEGSWDLLAQPSTSLKGVALLARALRHCRSPLIDGLLCRLLPALHSPRAVHRHISLFFCMELTYHPLMHNPELWGLLLKRLLSAAQDGNAILRILAMRGLGSVAEGAPQEVKKKRRALLATLIQAAGDADNPEVICESLRVLRKVWGHIGGHSHLQAVANLARMHLRHVDDTLRLMAFELFGHLAEAIPNKRVRMSARVTRAALAPLLLHFQDPNPAVAKACQTAFLTCAPFLGLQNLLGEVDVAQCTEMSNIPHSCLMDKVCRQLAHKEPALLVALVAEMPSYVHCAWEGIRLAACKLSGLLLEMVPCVGQLDLDPLLQSLHSLQGDSCPAIETAAAEALQIAQQRGEETPSSLKPGRSEEITSGRLLLSCWLFPWCQQKSPDAGTPRPA